MGALEQWLIDEQCIAIRRIPISQLEVDLAIRVSVSCSCFSPVVSCIFSHVNSCFGVL